MYQPARGKYSLLPSGDKIPMILAITELYDWGSFSSADKCKYLQRTNNLFRVL